MDNKKLENLAQLLMDHAFLVIVVLGIVIIATFSTLPAHEIHFVLTLDGENIWIDTTLYVWQIAYLGLFASFGKLFLILYFGLQVLPRIYEFWRKRLKRDPE